MTEGARLAGKGRGTRPRGMQLEVWVTREERAEIAARAAETGLSVSAYMRAAGLNHPIRSVLDLDAVADLGRVNGDLGRVAGLLKLWLAEKRGQGARPVDGEALMKDLRALQTELHHIMGQAVRGGKRTRRGSWLFGDGALHGSGQQCCHFDIFAVNQTSGGVSSWLS